ncbi:MAG: hypothetical protein QG602_233 [Verrucomicrobiota bacterium]|nr:hypothetical protein [Verrucomicrobiota bacterium]
MNVVRLCLLSSLLILAVQDAQAELPLVYDLVVPSRTNETLWPIKDGDLSSLESEYEPVMPSGREAAIYWQSGWGEPGVVVLFKDAKGGYQVGTEKRRIKGTERGLDFADLEPQLAQRLIKLIVHELARVGRGQKNNSVYVDVGYYYFTAASMTKSTGWTHGADDDTTLGRLCRVVDALTGLPNLTGSDRTRLLGEIDRGITAIEVAHKQHR